MPGSEVCGSSQDAQSSTHRHVNRALFPCHSRFSPLILTLGLLKDVVAQSTGLPFCHSDDDEAGQRNLVKGMRLPRPDEIGATTRIWR